VSAPKTKILILGATGMLGHAAFRYFSASPSYETFGTVRSFRSRKHFGQFSKERILDSVDVENFDSIVTALSQVRPNVVINCVGVIKQLAISKDPLTVLPINSLFPHRLARLCAATGARLIHVSTDCVFSGRKGSYLESDYPDAEDLYGRSKLLGEVDYPNAITLRTSIIGHELESNLSLVDWFLSQTGSVKGFERAIFSGLPTIEIARAIDQYVIPRTELRGLYHLSVEPINKYDLLKLVAEVYEKKIEINKDDQVGIDRSLDSSRFRTATGFHPRPWPELVRAMKESKVQG
jgi:dTDP-4-dehydrorhamnose reductase